MRLRALFVTCSFRILTSGPRYMTFTIERNITLVTNGLWNDVHDDKMKGIHQVCGMVYSDDG